ncbi:MAG: sodium:solute symporter family protein [Dehalococcoidia bacterium]|nr:sodium:solute symporter family protein [Dehalococcoidia bacterium]
MSGTAWAWLAVGLYVVLGFVIAIAARRHVGIGMSDFFLADRRVGGVISALTYSATTYSAFMLVGLAGLSYTGGVGALGFEMTYLCGLFLAVFFLPRFWLAGRRYGYITPMDLLTDRYQSKAVGAVAAILALVFLVPYSAAQLLGIGLLMSGMSEGGIPVLAGILVATLLAVAWSRIAGLRSIAWTDAFQAVVMMLSAILLLVLIMSELGGLGAFLSRFEAEHAGLLTVPSGSGMWSINMFIGLTLPWFFFCISNPQVSQRFFIPESVKAMRQMMGGFLVFGFFYTLIAVLWGFGAKMLVPGLANADMATPTLLALPFVPKALALVAMVGILAAAVSTIDSILLTLSSVWARDIYRGVLNRSATEAQELRMGQWVIPAMAVIALIFAWQASTKSGLDFMIAPLSAAASAGLLMVVPSIFGAFYWRRATAAGSIASIVSGAVVVLVLQVTGAKPLGWWPGVWGLLLCTVVFVAVSFATRAPKAKADEFLDYLADKLRSGNYV